MRVIFIGPRARPGRGWVHAWRDPDYRTGQPRAPQLRRPGQLREITQEENICVSWLRHVFAGEK